MPSEVGVRSSIDCAASNGNVRVPENEPPEAYDAPTRAFRATSHVIPAPHVVAVSSVVSATPAYGLKIVGSVLNADRCRRFSRRTDAPTATGPRAQAAAAP
jgi:hypothetical protein